MRTLFVAMSLASAAACLLSSATPVKEFKFEVFSIRPTPLGSPLIRGLHITPNGFTSRINMQAILATAYRSPMPVQLLWNSVKILHNPAWLDDTYDINARVAEADLKAWQNQSGEHELLRSALQAALKERCKLVVHDQPSQERIFELVIAKGGPKLKPTVPNAALPVGVKLASGGVMTGIGPQGRNGWDFHAATMKDLVIVLNSEAPGGTPVRDRTGLTGRYDFRLLKVEAPDEERIYSWPVDRLGLKLSPAAENQPILVIDHIEKPTPN